MPVDWLVALRYQTGSLEQNTVAHGVCTTSMSMSIELHARHASSVFATSIRDVLVEAVEIRNNDWSG